MSEKTVSYGGFCLYLLLLTILIEVSHSCAKKIKHYLVHKSLESCFLGNSERETRHDGFESNYLLFEELKIYKSVSKHHALS